MRIVCESCGTKYSISDEKVRGKLFKIRCKKCSHVIVVRGAQEEIAAAVEPADVGPAYGELPRESDAPVDEAAGYEWFYVVDGQQAGPIAPDDVGHYLATGELHADTYMWRDGMEDWIHLSEVPEFAALVEESVGAAAAVPDGAALAAPAALEATQPAPAGPPVEDGDTDIAGHIYAGSGEDDYVDEEEATRVMAKDSAEEPEPSLSESIFGPDEYTTPQQPSSDVAFAGAAAESRDFGAFDQPDDYYGEDATAPASLDTGGGGLFSGGGFSAAALESTDRDASQTDMVGARSENSVLFSLDTLAGVDTSDQGGGGSGLPTTEGSGLIDIKALAASQAVASPEINVESADQPMVTPAVMPIGHRQSHALLYGLMAAGAVIIIGLVLAIVLVLTGRQETEAQPQAAGPTTETPDASQVAAEQGAVDEADAAMAEVAPVAATGPSTEHIMAATQAGTLIGAYIAPQKAPAVAQAIADRPTRVASRERSSRRDRDRRSSRDTERTSSRDRDEEEESSRSSRTERESRSSASESDDPVDRALGRIQRPGREEEEEPEESSSESSRTTERESDSRSDLPEQLTTSQVSRSIRRYQRRLAECRQQSDLPAGEVLRVDVQMTVQGNGRVGSARSSSSDPAAPCIVDVVRDMRFDQFSGEAMTFTYPFRVR